jgi:hypothetical protein
VVVYTDESILQFHRMLSNAPEDALLTTPSLSRGSGNHISPVAYTLYVTGRIPAWRGAMSNRFSHPPARQPVVRLTNCQDSG